MRSRTSVRGASVIALACFSAGAARAAEAEPIDVVEWVGDNAVARMLGSSDPLLRRLGAERAAGLSDTKSLAAVVHATGPSSTTRGDTEAFIEAVRTLVLRSSETTARDALVTLVNETPNSVSVSETSSARDKAAIFARRLAAFGLARAANRGAVEALARLAERGGAGEELATSALAQLPFLDATRPGWLIDEDLLAHPHVAAAALSHGDRRALAAVVRAYGSERNAGRRAAWLHAWGESGDAGALLAAQTAATDRDLKVRLEAVSVLIARSAKEAGPAVVKLLESKETLREGLPFAEKFSDESVAASLARLLDSETDTDTRLSILHALGTQDSIVATGALKAAVPTPALSFDALSALARSPSSSALAALESLPQDGPIGRAVARTYLVRRVGTSEESRPLERLLERLRASADPEERSIGSGAVIQKEATAHEATPTSPPLSELVLGVRFETDEQRRADHVLALAQWRHRGAARPLLQTVAATDPAPEIRALAARALRGETREEGPPRVVWVRAIHAGSKPTGALHARLLLDDRPAIPFVFDADGDAMVLVTTRGKTRIVLYER